MTVRALAVVVFVLALAGCSDSPDYPPPHTNPAPTTEQAAPVADEDAYLAAGVLMAAAAFHLCPEHLAALDEWSAA